MTTVAIIDDHSVVRIGIKYVLRLARDLKLVAEGATAEDAVRIVREEGPDVLLLDVRMPGRGGVAALADILAARPDQRVLMLTTSDTEEDVFQSVRGGAKGYVLKETEPEALIDAIQRVAAGETAFPEEVRRIYEVRAGMRDLSPREKETLQAVAKGMSNVEIAGIFGISHNSVKMHLAHIFEKLGVTDRAEAVATAIRRGVIAG